MGVFLPRDNTTTASRVLLNQLDRGATANLMFASITGDDPDRLAEISASLVERWTESAYVRRVLNGSKGLGKSELAFLERYRYLIGPNVTAETFSEAGLRGALDDRLKGLSSSLAAIEKRNLRQDPTGSADGAYGDLADKKGSHDGAARAQRRLVFARWTSRYFGRSDAN